jgi:hypothetical protein
MSALYSLINLVIDTLKHLSWNGVSMWDVMQLLIWFNVLVWPLVVFFFGRTGSNDE